MNQEAEYFTTLIYSCGFSFSLVKNLLPWFLIFAAISLVWILLWVRDRVDQFICKPKERFKLREPPATNFIVRYIYEVYFTLSLSSLINLSFFDGQSKAEWYFCLLLTLLVLGAPIFLLLTLFCKFGPYHLGSYQPGNLFASFWGLRPLDENLIKQFQAKLEER